MARELGDAQRGHAQVGGDAEHEDSLNPPAEDVEPKYDIHRLLNTLPPYALAMRAGTGGRSQPAAASHEPMPAEDF